MLGYPAAKVFRYRGQALVLLGVLSSFALHAGALWWWISRPAPVAVMPGVEQTVTVDLLNPDPPAGAVPQPPATPPPAAPPEPEPLAPDEMAEQAVVVKKPPKKVSPPKPVAKPPVETPPAVPAQPASTAVPSSAPPAAAPLTAARYDAAYLNNPAPAYPSLSRRLGEQGKVVLRVQVSADGKPLAVELKHSSGFARLDEAASKAAAKWRFVPARQGEAAVTSWVEVPIQFSLKE